MLGRHTTPNVTIAHVLLLAIALTASSSRAGRIRFRDPDPKGPGQEVWQLTDRPLVKHVIEYHNTQCWSPNGRYVSYHSYQHGDLYVYDLQTDKEVYIGKGGGARWANKHNWMFYVARGPKGYVIMWLDADTGKKTVLCDEHNFRFLGETDTDDRWLFANQIIRERDGKRGKWFTTARIPIRPKSKAEFILKWEGRRPLPNPRHPVIMQRRKKRGPFLSSRIWFDYEGKNIRVATVNVQAGHQCWLGNGEYHLTGDDQIKGRKWNEPFPSDLHFLANIRAHDICPCGFSGRWVCTNGKIADLRSGHGKRYSFRYPYTPKPTDVASAGDTDCNPKGSPDGTKICFRSTADIRNGVLTRLTHSYTTKETQTIRVASTKGFPSSGAIVRFTEIIGYKRKTAGTFEDLTRGLYATRVRVGKATGQVEPLASLVVPQARRGNAKPNRLQVMMDKHGDKYRNTPVYWLRRQQVFMTVVRSPDPPHLRLKDGRVELIPGENHWETFGYHVLRDGAPITRAPIRPGATLKLTRPGVYTAIAEEWSDLKSKPSLPLKLEKGFALAVLTDKPTDFSWTVDRWKLGRKQVAEAEALKAAKATKEIVHRHEGVIHLEFFENGRRTARHDLNDKGQATRVLTYKDGKLASREYRHGPRTSVEHFGPDGYKTHDAQWYVKRGGPKRPYSKWWFERGIPVKRWLGGRVYVKKGDEWVRQEGKKK